MKSAILMFVLFALPLQGQKPSTIPSPDQGRYQLLPVTLGNAPQLFLFDSQTGRVWHYRPESFLPTGNAGKSPSVELEAFLPVMIQSAGKMQVTPDGN
ncbi:MAG: hypothetical protein WAL89_05775 [Candidatus Sulfotelmatobacter sp.]